MPYFVRTIAEAEAAIRELESRLDRLEFDKRKGTDEQYFERDEPDVVVGAVEVELGRVKSPRAGTVHIQATLGYFDTAASSAIVRIRRLDSTRTELAQLRQLVIGGMEAAVAVQARDKAPSGGYSLTIQGITPTAARARRVRLVANTL